MVTESSSIKFGEKEALEVSMRYSKVLSRVLQKCLDPHDEEVLVIGDYGIEERNFSLILSYAYYFAARDMGLKANIVLQQPKKKGEMADDNILSRLECVGENGIVLVNVSNRLGELKDVSYRDFMKSRMLRFCSSPSLGSIDNDHVEDFMSALDIDYDRLWDEHRWLKKKLDAGTEVIVKTESGTHLVMDIQGVKARCADGFYRDLGSGGNLPAGEVYVAPNTRNMYGKVVIDGSSRNLDGTIITVGKPITLEIEDGTIVSIDDPTEEKLLARSIKWAEEFNPSSICARQIGEFGIGLNPVAKLIGCMLLDEKARGTAHIAIGNNKWFGGENDAIIHLDQVFRNPVIKIDGEIISL